MPAKNAPEAPVADAPVADAPAAEAPVTEAPVAEAPVAEAPAATLQSPPTSDLGQIKATVEDANPPQKPRKTLAIGAVVLLVCKDMDELEHPFTLTKFTKDGIKRVTVDNWIKLQYDGGKLVDAE